MQLAHFAFDILLCVFIAGFTFTHIMQRAEIRALREQLSRRPSQPAPADLDQWLAEFLENFEMTVSAQAQTTIDNIRALGQTAQAAITAAKSDSTAVQTQAAADAAQATEDLGAINDEVAAQTNALNGATTTTDADAADAAAAAAAADQTAGG